MSEVIVLSMFVIYTALFVMQYSTNHALWAEVRRLNAEATNMRARLIYLESVHKDEVDAMIRRHNAERDANADPGHEAC
jgi:hypothetical protein